jgi:PhnB protein
MKIETYLLFNGQCEAAMTFYAKALGGKIEAMMKYGDSPAGPHNPPEMANHVIHACVMVGDAVLMASDAPEGGERKGFAVAVQADTPADVDRYFNALAEGGQVTMPVGETFFSKRFGMLVDKFGTPWMVNCAQPMG